MDGGPPEPARMQSRAARLERLVPLAQIALFRGVEDPLAGLPVAQLRLVRALGSGPQAPSALARALGLTAGAISQLTARLKQAGFVHELPDPSDRRTKRLQLTDWAQSLMSHRAAARAARVAHVLSEMSESEQSTVVAALETLYRVACSVDSARAEVPGVVDSADPISFA